MATLNVTVHDVLAANQLLVSLGADDQMPRLAMTAIERSLELQQRLDRALAYAAHVPPNSAHARQMARILDGSITIDDELAEVPETGLPMQRRTAIEQPAAAKRSKAKSPRGKLKPGAGLQGRSTRERLEIREWIAECGFDVAPSGRIPQKYIDAFDEYQDKMRNRHKEAEQLPMSG